MSADELSRLLDELEITGTVRAEMQAEPERALLVLKKARGARGIRNRAAFAISRWRERPAASRPIEPELVAGPPDLDALEYLWSRERSSVSAALVLKLIAVALERHGGFAAMRDSFERRRVDPA